MKNFTLFLAFIMLAFITSAQNKNNLQYKYQMLQEKFSRITQKTDVLFKLSEIQNLNQETLMKSAAAKQKLDSIVTQELNFDNQSWQYAGKDEFIYNPDLKNTSWLSKEWNPDIKAWEIRSKTELGYDSQKRVNSMTAYMSMESGQPLKLTSKFLNFYNSQGLQDSTLSYTTEDAGVKWILDMKQINHYNSSKQLIKVDIWSLDEDLGILIPGMNVEYTYTASGNIKTSGTKYIMEGEEILFSKTEYNYDASGKLISIEDSDLNVMTFALEKSYMTAYQYNSSGDASVEIYSDWNGTAWIETEKDENIYSTTNFSEVVFPLFYVLYSVDVESEITLNKQITSVNSFKKIDGSWKNTEKSNYYYSAATSTYIDETNATLFNVYPNPASDAVSFRWKGNYESLNLQIYQITGVKALEQITYPGNLVSISNLENGIYFFKLLNGQQNVHAGKLIKK